ncbi:hypothetical protein BDV09DRAFT_200371 [Aspergillus tetrazonus]
MEDLNRRGDYTDTPADHPDQISKRGNRFFIVANLVECTAIEELVDKLKRRKTITKERVLKETESNLRRPTGGGGVEKTQFSNEILQRF